MQTALVIGVTGQQGGATARHLLDKGWRVRGLTRNLKSRRANSLLKKGVELIQGDIDAADSLKKAMKDVECVFAVTPMEPKGYKAERELNYGLAIAQAAAEANVAHLVFSSVAGSQDNTGVPHLEVKGKIEDRIRELGLHATILRPNIFIDNLVNPKIAPIYWHLAPTIIGWEKPLAWVAADDIGKVAAKAFLNPERWAGTTLEIVGDRKSLGETLHIYREIRGRKPFRIPMPVWAFKKLIGEELVLMWQWQGKEDFGKHSPELQEMDIKFLDIKTFLKR